MAQPLWGFSVNFCNGDLPTTITGLLMSAEAAERSKKYGDKPSYYPRLFTTHTECAWNKNQRETTELMRRISSVSANPRSEAWLPLFLPST